MILYVILSDIHGNYQALKAVEEDARNVARQEGYHEIRFICLGDVVDYGPQPNECMQWVTSHAEIVIQGNHDKAVAAPFDEPPFSIAPDYWPITLWTRQVLQLHFKERLQGYASKKMGLTGLEHFTLVHSTLNEDDLYIDYTGIAEENLNDLETYYGLYGHTHYQGYFMERGIKVVMGLVCPTNGNSLSDYAQTGWHAVEPNRWLPLPGRWQRAIFNPGSVGQPRRHAYLIGAGIPHDYRAAYMLLRLDQEKKEEGAGSFQFRRVSYDVRETLRLLEQEISWQATTNHKPTDQDSRPSEIKLAEVLTHIQQRLPQLVNTRLIPKLRDG